MYKSPTMEVINFNPQDIVVNLASSIEYPEYVVEIDYG